MTKTADFDRDLLKLLDQIAAYDADDESAVDFFLFEADHLEAELERAAASAADRADKPAFLSVGQARRRLAFLRDLIEFQTSRRDSERLVLKARSGA